MDKLYTHTEVLAYAAGYYDGRADGVSMNLYDDDNLRVRYESGYAAGVRDYITFDEGRE